MSNAEKFDAEKTVDQAIITSSESDFDINELGKSVLDYLLKSLNQITLGNFTEYVTLLGTIGQILLGIFDVDILCDIRDLIADFDKLGTDEKVPIWQWALDIIALLPVIGAVKYTDEAAVLFKQADKIGNSEKYIDELDELMKHADEFSDVGKNADEAGEVSKYADELDDAGKGGKGGNDKGGSIKKSGTETSRPTWRQSELDAAKDFPDYDAQKSFINGEEVPYGTKGSVRPDYYKDGYSVDIKNYNVESASGRSNLARNIEKQYYQRIENLPEGTKQSVMIDIRGQNVTDADLSALYDDIMKRTDNGVEILFKMD